MTNRERYLRAAKAMQTGVAVKMHRDPTETSPKHLRVGVNASMSDLAALARLLIEKGIISEDEYERALADSMEAEAKTYTEEVSSMMGGANVTLGAM